MNVDASVRMLVEGIADAAEASALEEEDKRRIRKDADELLATEEKDPGLFERVKGFSGEVTAIAANATAAAGFLVPMAHTLSRLLQGLVH